MLFTHEPIWTRVTPELLRFMELAIKQARRARRDVDASEEFYLRLKFESGMEPSPGQGKPPKRHSIVDIDWLHNKSDEILQSSPNQQTAKPRLR